MACYRRKRTNNELFSGREPSLREVRGSDDSDGKRRDVQWKECRDIPKDLFRITRWSRSHMQAKRCSFTWPKIVSWRSTRARPPSGKMYARGPPWRRSPRAGGGPLLMSQTLGSARISRRSWRTSSGIVALFAQEEKLICYRTGDLRWHAGCYVVAGGHALLDGGCLPARRTGRNVWSIPCCKAEPTASWFRPGCLLRCRPCEPLLLLIP